MRELSRIRGEAGSYLLLIEFVSRACDFREKSLFLIVEGCRRKCWFGGKEGYFN
jgi:hypothetical protein